MKKALVAALVVAVSTVSGVTADAGPPDGRPAGSPEVTEEQLALDFPDFENGFVVFLNTTHDAVCTPEQLAAEYAFLEWFPIWGEAFFAYLDENMGDPTGFEGEFPPPEPPRPEGIDTFRVQRKPTANGAIVESVLGQDIPTEIWRQNDDPPGVGPCTDTLGVDGPYATGTAWARSNDNDLFGSGERGNAFGNHLRASMTDTEGNEFVYSARFHLTSRCFEPESAPPRCLIEGGTIR